MWVFTRQGFYSVVQKNCGEDEALVRSRQKSDLVALGKKLGIELRVQENAGTDYRFRAVVKKADWARYLTDAVLELDYSNFKNTVPQRDYRRHNAYMRCWEALFEWQKSLRGRKG